MMIGVWVAVSMGMDPWQDMGGRLQNVLCGCQLFGVENGCKSGLTVTGAGMKKVLRLED